MKTKERDFSVKSGRFPEFPKSFNPHFHLFMQSNQKIEDVKGENSEESRKRKGISRWQQKVHDKSDRQRLNVTAISPF